MQGASGKRTVRQDEFVEIRRYGPYLIAEKEEVRYFAKLALAMALRASEEEGPGGRRDLIFTGHVGI
ncbi:hypothetical protein N7535_003384 [Penicillium sp. DV-2018c]|nr:hypothetical protein N7535_003384 [Penicillium sp. DV-2018c]